MKKNIIWLICFILFVSCSAVWADLIYLKNGEVVEGKIAERKEYYVIITSNKFRPKKIYKGQIVDVLSDELLEKGVALSIDSSQFENISAEKVDFIVEFIKVSGVKDSMDATVKRMVEQAPKEDRLEMLNLFNVNKIVSELIPLYDKYYEEEDLVQIVDFYKSPAGKKLLKVTPKLMKEAVKVSVNYFQGQEQ